MIGKSNYISMLGYLTKCDFKVDKCEINYFIKDWSPKELIKLAQLKGEYYPEHAIGKVEFTFY